MSEHICPDPGQQDNECRCGPAASSLSRGQKTAPKARERGVWFAHTKAHTLAGDLFCFFGFRIFLIFYREGSGLEAPVSLGFLVTSSSKPLFHLNYSMLSVGAASSCLRITGSLLSCLCRCSPQLLINRQTKVYAHYFCAV